MAYYTAAYTDIRINDDARFRTQGSWIATQLETIGWTKTGDTGQINWTTVSAPAAADSSQGYEIRDSSEGIRLKIEWGSGAYVYSKAFWLTVGLGSDGAGTITDPILARTQVRSATAYTGGVAKPGDDYVSGDAHRVMVAVTDDQYSGGYNGAFMLQKTHNASLTEDAYGWWLLVLNRDTTSALYCLGRNAAGTMSDVSFGMAVLPRSVGDASNVPTLPMFAPHPLYGFVAMRDAFAAPASLAAQQTTATISGRTYLSVGPNSIVATVWSQTLKFAHNMLLRYE